MKYVFLFISIAFAAYLFFSAPTAFAYTLRRNTPYGGRITSTTKGGVVCYGGTGPVTQKSSGNSVAGDYFYPTGQNRAPSMNKWVLGLYQSVLDESSCYIEFDPYPVYKIEKYGIGR